MRFRIHLVLAVIAFAVVGCASGPDNTRLDESDVEAMTSEMAANLRMNFLRERSPSSPSVKIAISKVQNDSRQLMDESEQWAIMNRVAKSVPLTTLSRQANVQFVVERDLADAAQQVRGTIDKAAFRAREVTHVMRAVFETPTRQAGQDRTDLYMCRFSILDLDSGEDVWSASFDFKKISTGKGYD